MFKCKYLATSGENETVGDEVVTVVVAIVNAVQLQSMFEKLFSIIISNDLAYIGCKENAEAQIPSDKRRRRDNQ